MTATRILKADLDHIAARRVRLSDLSETAASRFDSASFEPLTLPAARSPQLERQPDPRLESALAALQSAADQVQAQRDHWLDQSQHEAVRIGVAIAERLLRRTLDVQPEAVLDLIRSALDWSVGTDPLQVRLHPADAALVTTQPRDTNRAIEFVPDHSLVRGDCIIETPNGQTDARLDVILQRITDELLMS